MAFEELADKIEIKKQQLAAGLAELVIKRRIPSYNDIATEELTRQFLPHFEMTVRYIRESNPAVWSDYYIELVQARFSKGFSFESVMTISEAHYDVMYQFVDQEWPTNQHLKLNQKYRQRVQGMQTLSETTVRQVYFSSVY